MGEERRKGWDRSVWFCKLDAVPTSIIIHNTNPLRPVPYWEEGVRQEGVVLICKLRAVSLLLKHRIATTFVPLPVPVLHLPVLHPLVYLWDPARIPFTTTCQYIHLLHSCIHACVRLYPLKMCIGVEVKTNRRRGTTGETTSFQALGLHGSHRWKMKSQTTLYCGWDFWLTSVAVISGVSTQSVLRRLATMSTDNVSHSVLYCNNYIWTKTLVYQAAGWLESFATIVFSSFKHCVRCSAHWGHQFMFASVMLGLDGTFVSYLSLQMCHNS